MHTTIKGYFIDVQGTLIDDIDKEPINGACDLIDYLNNNDIPYVVITNNTKQNSDVFLQNLKNKGLNIKNYIDPFFILKDIVKSKKVAAFGTLDFLNVLNKMGYELDFQDYEALIVSIKKDYNNEEYSSMIECAIKTNNLIAMHETSIYCKNEKRYPGVGAIMNMIKFAVNKDYKVVGKPSLQFFKKAKELINIEFKDITVISDDMIGDLIGASKLNMKTCLVLSGKIKEENEIIDTLSEEELPNYICKDMSKVLELLKKGEV